MLLHGPNAVGKSCYLRQTGLLAAEGQIGKLGFRPRSCRGWSLDRIFTRVGAVDDLAAGRSHLHGEMAETANILPPRPDRSLLVAAR